MVATPRTWVVGEVVTAALLNQEIREPFNDLIAAWTSYAPAWGAGTAPNIGNGTLSGRYRLIGKTCTVEFGQTMGTTTTFGTGVWTWTVPFTAASPPGSDANFTYTGAARGHAAAWYSGTVGVMKGTNLARIYPHKETPNTEWASGVPTTWAASTTNYLHAGLTYEIA
ncbi:hypothetical protein [Streptomyces sp. NPDC023838]|uniref:hypothetical protein n=1 Tax=Streptomyces sp. NPDC023838 TaxID=3154325 RepID=UPI0033E1576E